MHRFNINFGSVLASRNEKRLSGGGPVVGFPYNDTADGLVVQVYQKGIFGDLRKDIQEY